MSPLFDYLPAYLSAEAAANLMDELSREAEWRQEHVCLFGQQHATPRLTCWYGTPGVGYRYSSTEHRATGWLPALERLAAGLSEDLSQELQEPFNFVLLNRYRDGADSMGWHSDDEHELGSVPVIASISLGATRRLRVRPRRKPSSGRRRSEAIELAHGSLLVMRANSQRDYEHQLARTARPVGERINLTFRCVLPA